MKYFLVVVLSLLGLSISSFAQEQETILPFDNYTEEAIQTTENHARTRTLMGLDCWAGGTNYCGWYQVLSPTITQRIIDALPGGHDYGSVLTFEGGLTVLIVSIQPYYEMRAIRSGPDSTAVSRIDVEFQLVYTDSSPGNSRLIQIFPTDQISPNPPNNALQAFYDSFARIYPEDEDDRLSILEEEGEGPVNIDEESSSRASGPFEKSPVVGDRSGIRYDPSDTYLAEIH